MSFSVISVDTQPWDTTWRPGVRTRNWSAEIDGARELHVGEQFFEPGKGVPPHWHTYEEHLVVIEGSMEFRADGESHVVSAPACVVVHARTSHEFKAVGATPLHIFGAISSPIHESFFESQSPGTATRQYEAAYQNGARRVVRVDSEIKPVVDVAP
jgi:quercetin dioxygenase-like cupin family protein